MPNYSAHEIFADNANDYLDTHNIYELFGSMLKDLVVNQPADPYAHMLTLLERPAETLRVCIFGPPGSGVEEARTKILAKFKLVQIEVENLLQTEVDNKTSLGAKVKDCRDNDMEITDDLITSIIKSRLNKSDCASKGWILDGYPTNARQLHCLQTAGILPNKVAVLTVDKEVCREEALKHYEGMTTEEFNEAYADYTRNIKQIEPLFPADSKRFIDASQSGSAVQDEIIAFCGKSAPCKAPRRPMRVCLLGQTGSGKETQAKKLAHTYGLVHVSVGSLLRKEMAKSFDLREQLEAFTKEGQLVPDYIVCPIVADRLLQADCRSRGWCLDGFPRTRQQASSLAKVNLAPNRVVFLEVAQGVSEGRCLSRRIDPETRLVYDMREDGSAPQQVAKRLITQDKDTANILKNLLSSYNNSSKDLKESYGGTGRTIDGSQSEDAVFTDIQTFYLAALGAARFGEE